MTSKRKLLINFNKYFRRISNRYSNHYSKNRNRNTNRDLARDSLNEAARQPNFSWSQATNRSHLKTQCPDFALPVISPLAEEREGMVEFRGWQGCHSRNFLAVVLAARSSGRDRKPEHFEPSAIRFEGSIPSIFVSSRQGSRCRIYNRRSETKAVSTKRPSLLAF